MRFCDVCRNMLYIKLADENRLTMYCKNCGLVRHPTKEDREDACAFVQDTSTDETADYRQYMTPDIKHDPTLPRVRHIKCPNGACPSTDDDREVVFIKYDHTHLKYLYFCCTCETFWKT